jgi:hypothetical protein
MPRPPSTIPWGSRSCGTTPISVTRGWAGFSFPWPWLQRPLLTSRVSGARREQIAVAGSTLAVAALFGPARSRTQDLIDSRFYRTKYDAGKTLDHFASRLREEVDIDAFTSELLTVVSDTMHPRHVTLWLAPANGSPALSRETPSDKITGRPGKAEGAVPRETR